MIKADDGDGHTDTATVEIRTEVPVATPTATPKEPGFEAVFAHFFFLEKTFFLKKEPVLRKKPFLLRKNLLRKNAIAVLLVKLFFLRKGLC